MTGSDGDCKDLALSGQERNEGFSQLVVRYRSRGFKQHIERPARVAGKIRQGETAHFHKGRDGKSRRSKRRGVNSVALGCTEAHWNASVPAFPFSNLTELARALLYLTHVP